MKTADNVWINGRSWDLAWLVGSAAIIPAMLLAVWGGINSDLLTLSVTVLVGGPHVFSTMLTTYLDPQYRRGHGLALVVVGLAIPAVVVYMTIHHFQVLMSFFIFVASIHVILQNAYLTDVYRKRSGEKSSLTSRFLDYALLLLSFYPIAAYKLVHDDFMLGDLKILIPSIAKTPFTYMAISAAFAVVVPAWIIKTVVEARRGIVNFPKTLLIAVTSTIAFLVPATASGDRLELAFQTVNAWHSIQYLAIIWVVLKMRKAAGRIESPLVAMVSGPGKASVRFYALCIAFTSGMFGVMYLLRRADPLKITTSQYYYMTVLSVLLIHYAFDGYFFVTANGRQVSPDSIPLAVPSTEWENLRESSAPATP
jgi:hypothetical protein